MVINPKTGSIEQVIDFSGLKKVIKSLTKCFKWHCISPQARNLLSLEKTGVKSSKLPYTPQEMTPLNKLLPLQAII